MFGINQFQFPEMSFSEFIHYGWKYASFGTWLRLSVVLNVLPFILFINSNRLKSAQGVIFGTILYGLFIVYLILFQ
jgi:hypothetical protein